MILRVTSSLQNVNRLLGWNFFSCQAAKSFALYLLVFGERVGDRSPLTITGDTWNESPSAAESLSFIILHHYASFFLPLPPLLLIGPRAAERSEVLGGGPVTCVVISHLCIECDKTKPLIDSFIKSSIQVTVKMPVLHY